MAIASSPSRFESWYRSKISPQMRQRRWVGAGTAISAPFTGRRTALRFTTIVAPQAGQASSGRPLWRFWATFKLGIFFFFMIVTLVLVERNHHAVVPQDDLDVAYGACEFRLEEVHPLACYRGLQPPGRVLHSKTCQDVAGILLIQADVQACQLAPSLQGQEHLARHRKLSDSEQDLGEPAWHIGSRPLFG